MRSWATRTSEPAPARAFDAAGTGHARLVDATILVGSGELLMISCGWTGREDVIGGGCEELLASVSAG